MGQSENMHGEKAVCLPRTWVWMSWVAMGASLVSCSMWPYPFKARPEKPVKMYDWHDQGKGKLSVKIELKSQKARYYRGEQEIGWSYVCTGKDGHETPTGKFRVMEKRKEKESNLYGWITDQNGVVTNPDATPKSKVSKGEVYRSSLMKEWMRLTHDGVGMHAGDIPQPGEAQSHGCVRVPREFAPTLYSAVEVGTPVEIVEAEEKPKT